MAQESSITTEFPSESRFECPICLTWLRDPVVTSCGHRFCRNCIESWLAKEENAKCPIDSIQLKQNDIFPDNFTRREISQQKIKCPNLLRGCLKEFGPLDLETHLTVCEFKPVESTLPDNEKLRCFFVDVGCEMKFEDEPSLNQHMDEEIQRHLMLLSNAYRNLSINQTPGGSATSAAIAQEANFWDPPSKSASAGSSSSGNEKLKPNESIENLLKALYEKIIILEQKTREQDIIIANIAQQLSTLNQTNQQRNCNGNYIWHLKDFKTKVQQMQTNQTLMFYSHGFYTSYNGYKFCVRFNLSPKNRNYVAILVHMMESGHDNVLDWPFTGRISIMIVHPTEALRNIKETMMTRPDLDCFKSAPDRDMNPRGFGYTEFVEVDQLLKEGYVQNNQLMINVQIQCV